MPDVTNECLLLQLLLTIVKQYDQNVLSRYSLFYILIRYTSLHMLVLICTMFVSMYVCLYVSIIAPWLLVQRALARSIARQECKTLLLSVLRLRDRNGSASYLAIFYHPDDIRSHNDQPHG